MISVGIIRRYSMVAIIKATLAVLLIATAVDIFVEFANEIKNIGSGDYGLAQALLYVPMVIPADLYTLFPMIGLLGVLIGLGTLSSHSELLVMRASGVSLLNIMQAVFISAVIIGVIAINVGEVIAPILSSQAKALKQEAITGNQAIETSEGVWMHVGEDFFNIAHIVDRSRWMGVTRYHFDSQNKLLAEAWARNVVYRHGHWLALSVSETIIFKDRTQSAQLTSQIWPITITPDALAYGFNDAQQMSLSKLHAFIHYRAQAKLPLNNYSLDFWQRIFQPLAMLVMMMLAIPFVFVSARSGTIGVRVLVGVIVSMGFYLLSQLLGQFSIVYRIPAWIGAFLPIAIFFVIGVWLLRRVK
ncbi:MAG: LPS export ABC transporter permease LptG [Gammaproteobacteria bacterium]|nr:LPS export ABC transporter permease LptG [Gammaproteobacteria bacterium]